MPVEILHGWVAAFEEAPEFDVPMPICRKEDGTCAQTAYILYRHPVTILSQDASGVPLGGSWGCLLGGSWASWEPLGVVLGSSF